jgi:hypothetical protein
VHGAAAGQEDAGDSVDSAGKRDSVKGAPQITAIRPEAIIAGLFFMTGKSCRRPARQYLLSEFPKMRARRSAVRKCRARNGGTASSRTHNRRSSPASAAALIAAAIG